MDVRCNCVMTSRTERQFIYSRAYASNPTDSVSRMANANLHGHPEYSNNMTNRKNETKKERKKNYKTNNYIVITSQIIHMNDSHVWSPNGVARIVGGLMAIARARAHT